MKNFMTWRKRIFLISSILITLLLAISAFIYVQFRASLPILEGDIELSTLSGPATIERDEDGNATITATTEGDLAFLSGYLHAQERFFQMDLSRRLGAGELSALFGDLALEIDKEKRLHRFRSRATEAIKRLPAEHREILSRYTNGVNEGLTALGRAPFEYDILQAEPQKWAEEDTFLTTYSMFFALQHSNGGSEWNKYLIEQSLGPDLAKFILPERTEWDAPIQKDEIAWQNPKIPEFVTQESEISRAVGSQAFKEVDPVVLGSNGWVVSGALTKTGSAILSDDMHLGISAPGTWFRLRLKLSDHSLDVSGVSLPGAPAIVAGSNGSVAWGFTNSAIDTSDLIGLKINPDNRNEYLTAEGYKAFNNINETIEVKDGVNQVIVIQETIWGPVLQIEADQPIVFKWVAHKPEAVNLGFIAMHHTKSVSDAMSIAADIGLPTQNAMLADKGGNIGWTLFGKLPKRKASDNPSAYTRVSDWSDGKLGWQGWYSSKEQPKIYNPGHNRLWSANSRVVSGEYLNIAGDGRYDLGARQKQIRDDLFGLKAPVGEADLYKIQLDNRAVLLARWQEHLLYMLKKSEDRELKSFEQHVKGWGGKADKNSIGFRLVRSYRAQLARSLFDHLSVPCVIQNQACDYFNATNQWESPLWQIVQEQPTSYLPKGSHNWQKFFETMARKAWSEILSDEVSIEEFNWGDANRAMIKHPLSGSVPGLGLFTDMPETRQSGDTANMPHIAGRYAGQSNRIVVSPGHEEDGILNMPAGQSGHPLSPYFGAGHRQWVTGNKTPFLPGKTKWKISFRAYK